MKHTQGDGSPVHKGTQGDTQGDGSPVFQSLQNRAESSRVVNFADFSTPRASIVTAEQGRDK